MSKFEELKLDIENVLSLCFVTGKADNRALTMLFDKLRRAVEVKHEAIEDDAVCVGGPWDGFTTTIADNWFQVTTMELGQIASCFAYRRVTFSSKVFYIPHEKDVEWLVDEIFTRLSFRGRKK